MLQSWANDSALLWPPAERKQQVGECWVCVIFFPRLVTREGVTGGEIVAPVRCTEQSKGGDSTPCSGSGAAAQEKKIGPYFLVGGPAHGFVHGFAHGFGA